MRVKLVSAILMFAVLGTLVGCGGGSTSTTNNPPPPPPPAPTLQSLAITPYAPAVSLGTPLQLTLTGTYSDGSQKDVTSSGSWSSDTAGVATVSANGGLVTGVAAGVATIKVNIGSVGASTPLDVTSLKLGNGALSGSYAFLISTSSSNTPGFVVGTFTTDSNGNITGGTVDVSPTAGTNPAPLGNGTYNVFADGRGTATLTIMGNKITVAFIISQDGSKGKMISFDKNVSAGIFERQTGSTTLNSGKFVFGFAGQNSAANYVASVGLFDTTANTGIRDVKSVGIAAVTSPAAGELLTSISINADGAHLTRSTATFTGTLTTNNYVLYLVDKTKAYFVETTSGQVAAGIAEQQAPSPVAPSGAYSFLIDHVASSHGTFERSGQLDIVTSTNITGTEDDDAGQNNQTVTPPASLNMDLANAGRGQIKYSINGGPVGHSAAIYVLDANRFAMMDADSSRPGVGVAYFVPAATNVDSNSTPFMFSLTELGELNLMTLGEMVLSTSGGALQMSGIAYNNNNGTTAVSLVGASTTAGTVNNNRSEMATSSMEAKDLIFYVAGTNKAIGVGADPDIDGVFDEQ